MLIAVDFDGTIVEHKYPAIGPEIPFAIETLKKLQAERHKLILWSVREGKLLEEAVEFCRQRGLEFYAVNRDYPEEEKGQNNHYSRKLKADLFIDDRNLGGLPDWGTIYEMVTKKLSYEDLLDRYENDTEPEDNKKKEDETCTELKMVYGAMKDFEHQSEFIERIQKIIGISKRTEKINEGLYKCIAKNSALMYKKTNGAINLYAMEQLIPINEMIKVKMPERIESEYSELLEEGEENKFDLKDVKERFIDKMVKELHRKAKEEEQPDSTFMKYLGDIDEEQSQTLIKCFKKYNPDIKKREMAKILRIAKGEENEYIYESKKNIKAHRTIDDEDIEIIRQCMELGLIETLSKIPSEQRRESIKIINKSLNERLNKQKRLQVIQNAKVAKKEDIPEVKKAKIDKGFDR